MKYHHIGIPAEEPKPGEVYIPHLKMYATGCEGNDYGIEWIRFEEGNTMPELVKKVAHVAFEVPDLDTAIEGKKVIIQPNAPSDGVRVAFIEENGAPVEFLEFSKR